MKIDFSRLDALRPTAAVPEGFEPVPVAAGEAREEIWLRAAAAMGEKVAAFPDQPFAAALFAAVWQELERRYAGG